MSIKLMSQAWEMSCESHVEKLVLLALTDNASDQGYCWPSIKTIARKCELSEQAVRNNLTKLRERGILNWEQGGGHSSNKYTLTLPPLSPVDPSLPLRGIREGGQTSLPLRADLSPVGRNRHKPSMNRQLKAKTKFAKPEFSELQTYAEEIRLPILEVNAFFDHHEARGWVLGRGQTPMKDWKSAMRTWKRNGEKYKAEKITNAAPAKYVPGSRCL